MAVTRAVHRTRLTQTSASLARSLTTPYGRAEGDTGRLEVTWVGGGGDDGLVGCIRFGSMKVTLGVTLILMMYSKRHTIGDRP
jgi:hypothetical protein